MEDIGAAIKAGMAMRNFSGEDMAVRLGCSRGTISQWKRGVGISTDNLKRVALVLGFRDLVHFLLTCTGRLMEDVEREAVDVVINPLDDRNLSVLDECM